jgi:hypothetical protein
MAKLSKSFSLLDSISVGVDRMQRNFEPMRKQVEGVVTAHVIIYEAFIESELVVPKHLARLGHGDYFRNLKNSSLGRFGAFQMPLRLRLGRGDLWAERHSRSPHREVPTSGAFCRGAFCPVQVAKWSVMLCANGSSRDQANATNPL